MGTCFEQPTAGNKLALFCERGWNRSKRILSNPPLILSIVLLIISVYLVILPLISVLVSSVTLHSRDTLRVFGKRPGEFTTYYLKRVFASDISDVLFYEPLKNTLLISFCMSILAITIGTILAWFVVRTDLPFKRFISNMAVVPYILPSWTLSLAWLTIFKNRTIGGTTGILEYFGMNLPDWISYGPLPIIITMALHYYPFAFLLIGSAFKDFDTRLEEAALVLGGNQWAIQRRVVLPMVTPAIASSFILTISRGIGSFSTPVFLGNPINYRVLSTRLHASLQAGSPGDAFVIAIVMILLAATFIFISNKVVGKRKSFVTISGQVPRAKLINLGKWRYVASGVILLFLFVVIVVPLFVLAADTFMRVPGVYSPSNFTLHYWIGKSTPGILDGRPGILRDPQTWRAFFNSVKLGLSSSVLSAVFGILIGYTVVNLRGTWLSSALDQISFLPYLIPSIAFGAIYLSLFAKQRGPIPSLYGTFLLIILATTAKNFPFAAKSGISAMMQLGQEIEEAGIIAGAGWLTRMRRLVLPLQRSGLLNALILPFISAMRELSMVVILITPGTQLLTTLTFRYSDYGFYHMSNAVVLLLVIVILVMTNIMKKLTGSELSEGLGGN